MENIDEDIEDLGLGKQQKIDLINLLRTFKKEGLGNFIVVRKEKFENLLSRLKTAERMNDVLADNLIECGIFVNSTIEDVKEWARKKVEDEL